MVDNELLPWKIIQQRQQVNFTVLQTINEQGWHKCERDGKDFRLVSPSYTAIMTNYKWQFPMVKSSVSQVVL